MNFLIINQDFVKNRFLLDQNTNFIKNNKSWQKLFSQLNLYNVK